MKNNTNIKPTDLIDIYIDDVEMEGQDRCECSLVLDKHGICWECDVEEDDEI